MALGGCAGELSMKVVGVWREVRVEKKMPEFGRTTTSVGHADASDLQNRPGWRSGRDGGWSRFQVELGDMIADMSATLKEDI